MKLRKGSSYTADNSDLKVIVHKIHYESNEYYKVKISIVHKGNGYIWIYNPNHPRSKGNKGLYVQEHILIAEKKIGRKIKKNEDVHHIDENKTNNDPENLMVMKKSDHTRLHNYKRWLFSFFTNNFSNLIIKTISNPSQA